MSDEFKINMDEILQDVAEQSVESHIKDLEDRIAKGEELDLDDRIWLACAKAPKQSDLTLEEDLEIHHAYWAEQDKTLITEEVKAATFAVTDLAFAELLQSHPELAETIDDMRILVSYSGRTVSTDTKDVIYLNPDYIATLKPNEAKHCMGFLAWSCMNKTIERRPEGADNKKWEAACNLLANRYLIDEHVGRLPTNALFMVGYDHETMTIEQVYKHLETFSLDDLYMNAWPHMVRDGELIEGEYQHLDSLIDKVLDATEGKTV